MQQLQWNSMISQHQTGGAGAGPAADHHHQQTILGASNNGITKTTPSAGGTATAAGKSPSQMSLQEILASSEYRGRHTQKEGRARECVA
jgi:hypothetical protein